MRYVLDASVAARWFLGPPADANADSVLRTVVCHPEHFAVPELFAFELIAVLYRHHRQAQEIILNDVDQLLRSGILRYPMTPGLLGRVNRFITRGLTGFDATYVALAEELEAIWLTFDGKTHARIAGEGLSMDLSVESF